MKIFVPASARRPLQGGGWVFTRNIMKALAGKVEFVDVLKDADIYFIPGPTLAERAEVTEAKRLGKKIVFRVDNVPRNSRNRNTGTSRLYDFAQIADSVIYQSEWAKNWIMPFVKKDGHVILNGCDTDIFKPEGEKNIKEGKPQYLYSRYNRDEIKRWEKAWYLFQMIYYDNPKAHLWIVGRFTPEYSEYGFDFFGGAEERFRYLGLIEEQEEMARIYRAADFFLYTYEMDACSNTLVEAVMCGLKIVFDTDDDGSAFEVVNADKKDLTLEGMGKKYLEVFKEMMK